MCFQHHESTLRLLLSTEPPCLAELERIQIQEAAKKKPGEEGCRGGGQGVALSSPEARRFQLPCFIASDGPTGGPGLGPRRKTPFLVSLA